jgi:hypothetical protein
MRRNLAVVEVKPGNASLAEFREDLLHLRHFLEGVYGDISEKRRELSAGEFETIFRGLNEKQSLFMLHERPGQPARVIHTIP